MSKKMRILHVIDALNHGGAQRLLMLLAEKAPRDRVETGVLVLQPRLELKEALESLGVRVRCCNRERPSILSPHRFLSYVLRNLREIAAFCRSLSADVLHCHLSDAELLGIPSGRLCGVSRVFTTVHYPDLLPKRKPADLRNALRRALTRILYNHLADGVVTVSRDTAEILSRDFGVRPEKIQVILNGVDVASFSPRTPPPDARRSLGFNQKDCILINVARLAPPKGQAFLVEAMARLTAQFPGIRLLFVGDGELRAELEARRASLRLEDTVVFLGNRSDIADLLALSDIFVFSSVSEGTSLALLEAMAAGKPIVATSIPGNEEVLRHGENAYLVPPGDPDALARGVAFLLDHPDEAQRLAAKGQQEVAAQFDIGQTIARYRALWTGLDTDTVLGAKRTA